MLEQKGNKILKAKNKIVRYSLIIYTFFLITFLSVPSLWAATYYVAQNAAGRNTGADCANANSLSWFNSNARGGIPQSFVMEGLQPK